ncbi:MAG: AI-2E family transporter [Acidobacteria bacterium]|nr:AI-2E family transporter [Acidobacteriota bacterium]
MTIEKIQVSARANPSQRIIATGIVLAFCYWAASVVMTLLLSVLLAYLLDPLVEWLESLHIHRAVGSLLVLLLALALVAGLGYMVFDRADHFAADWPKYSSVLRQAAAAVERRLERLEKRVSEITPGEEQRGRLAVRVEEQRPVRSLLLRGLGSLYTVLLEATFVPFLIFFMLAAKRNVWHATLQLFPTSQRTRVKQTLEEVSSVLRGYVVGNALVALILAVVSALFFWMIRLDYPFLTGAVSGLLNLVPYLGAMLAWIPPFVIGLSKWKTSAWPYLGVAGMLSFFHLIAINVLVPALVGRRVQLNALAVTVSLLFWGWLWGGVGLILAIPITATAKVICDNVESWQPVGRWLGA